MRKKMERLLVPSWSNWVRLRNSTTTGKIINLAIHFSILRKKHQKIPEKEALLSFFPNCSIFSWEALSSFFLFSHVWHFTKQVKLYTYKKRGQAKCTKTQNFFYLPKNILSFGYVLSVLCIWYTKSSSIEMKILYFNKLELLGYFTNCVDEDKSVMDLVFTQPNIWFNFQRLWASTCDFLQPRSVPYHHTKQTY